ncbi:hypothetical protein SAMN04488128_1061 [Chitinophaga eiseniae]|uniref:Uncharacterized protein n=1 Tax=Chitinophaga eiseniae TaxID=634771 RepID=A0A1T4TQK1_9BACT|nr:hypothetical protein [Chitinophaga eiseniae]SKA42697.1 hypothetical protein SAMN04488128_1061 [Chitinophaga eiseniae]
MKHSQSSTFNRLYNHFNSLLEKTIKEFISLGGEIPQRFLTLKEKIRQKHLFLKKRLSYFLFWFKERFIKGPLAAVSCLLSLGLFFLFGLFLAPSYLEILDIPLDSAKTLSSGLFSAFIGSLSAVVAIAAFIMAILQLINRRISISEFIFKNTYFILFTYWGLFCISILGILQLVTPTTESSDLIQFRYIRSLNIMAYTFVIFITFGFIVFTRIFRYLNFSLLIEDYLRLIPYLLLEEGESKDSKGAKKLSKIGNEIYAEIHNLIGSGETILLDQYLKSLQDVFRRKPVTLLLQNLSWHMVEWHSKAIITQGNISTMEQYWTLQSSWRELRNTAVSSDKTELRSYFAGIPGAILEKLYSIKWNSRSIEKIAESYSMNLKEMAVYPIWFSSQKEQKYSFYNQIEWILEDFIIILEVAAKENDSKTIEKVLIQLDQIPERISLDEAFKSSSDFASEEAPVNDEFAIIGNKQLQALRTRVENLRYAIACRYLFPFYYHGNYTSYKHETFLRLLPDRFKFVNAVKSDILEPISYSFLYWQRYIWGLEEIEDGKSYRLPTESDVLSLGIIAILLNSNRTFESLKPHLDFDNIKHFAKSTLETLEKHSKIHFKIMNEKRPFELTMAAQRVLEYFREAEILDKWDYSLQLSNATVSPEKVDEFKQLMVSQWKRSRNLYTVFKHYDAVVQNPEEELLQVGPPRMHLQNGKMMFVNEPLTRKIYNINWAANVNVLIEKVFTSVVTTVFKRRGSDQSKITDALEQAIKKSNFKNPVAFVGRRSFSKWSVDLYNSGNYRSSNGEDDIYPYSYFGIYKEHIPIVGISDTGFTDSVVIIDMGSGMNYLQRTNPVFIESQLQLEILFIDDAEAEKIVKGDPELLAMSKKEPNKAMKIAKANCLILIQEIMNFKIIKEEAFLVFHIVD